MNKWTGRGTLRAPIVLIGAVLMLVGVSTLVGASEPNAASHPRGVNRVGAAAVQPLIAGQANGGGCRMGYDTQTSTNTPPDDSTSDNVPANSVTISKPCPGAVVGAFSGEVSSLATSSDFIHLDMRATCTGTGGFASPCTVGQQVFGSPGHTFLANGPQSFGVRSMTMVWTGLRRGIWRFDVLPGGNGVANLQFRTFVVEAFSGG